MIFPAYSIGQRTHGGSPPSSVSVSGTVEVGATLTCTATGATSYQWQRAATFGGGGSFSNIGGATSSTYTAAAADVGFDLRCIATNAYGSTTSSNTIRTAALETYLGSTAKILLDDRGQSYTTTNLDSWANQGSLGSSFTATGALRPVSGTTINGYTAPAFGGSAGMTGDASFTVSALSQAGTRYTEFFVLIADSISAGANFAGAQVLGDTAGYHACEVGSSTKIKNCHWDGADKTKSDTLATGTATLIENGYDGTTASIRVGSAAAVTGAAGSVQTTTGRRDLGIGGAGTTKLVGKVAFVLVCDTALSATKESTVRAWCANKYGVAA